MKEQETNEFIELRSKLIKGELSEQEVFELPILLAERNEYAKTKWENLNKKTFILSLLSTTSYLNRKDGLQLRVFLENLKNIIRDGKTNREEIEHAISTIYSIWSEVNLIILLEQMQLSEDYEDMYIEYLKKGKENFKDIQTTKELLKGMDESKQKIKKLSTQYINY